MSSDFTFSIITMNRSKDLETTLSSLSKKINLSEVSMIITDNASSEKHALKNKNLANKYDVDYYYLDNNLGVSGGRNFALKKAKTKYVIEIDDDVEFLSDNFLLNIKNHFKDKNCAVVAFNIVSDANGFKFRREERPFFNKNISISNPIKSAWFIGAGHAFDLDKIKELKFYRSFFPYGSEESDLSLRVYDNNYHIIFDPDIIIHHIKTPSARIPDRSLFALRLAHRIKVSMLNLPVLSIISYSIIRSIQFIILSKSILTVIDAFKLIFKDLQYIKSHRKKIRYKTVFKLIRINGHIFF
jgi:GT2 family glycosyltransferase